MAGRPGLILEHGRDGPPGLLAEWLDRRGIAYEILDTRERPELLAEEPAGRPFVVSLGSEHSVRDADPTWIPAELELLGAAVRDEVPVLGLCFGGQGLSTVLGGGVDRLSRPEIGWISLRRSEVPWLAPGPWLYYHHEALRVPPGATELGRADSGPAAFCKGPHLGVQFHPEVTPEILDRWARSDPHLAESGLTPEALAEQSAASAPLARDAARRLFDAWWQRAGKLSR
jgi:GMP synthase-like glutamine amidotransferase